MRPALGTFVEISAAGRPPDQLIAAIDRAFAEIARVEQLMSFHRPESDIGRINRSHGAIEIHPWTARVLRL
ncbi:MAG: thiamine biosynthesis protein ApbE, partial [Halothiobacillus sp. 14-55-98]